MKSNSEQDSLVSRLVRQGDLWSGRPALIAGDLVLDHGSLLDRIECAAQGWDLPNRSVVALVGANRLDFVISYLATVAAGHVPLLLAPGAHERVAERWNPDALVTFGDDGPQIERRPAGRRELHPDLALLLSTSGSTGSPKLVRLAHRGVVANARAIGEYLALTCDDRAITSLPLHYCYGLSVLHSHLLAGASIVLTEASVVDPCFHHALERHGVTNVAGVPHTFELLDRSGFLDRCPPSMRFLTQAGGRLPAEQVRHWAERLAERDIDLFVMYGQTEATARMAYLPPHLAAACPGAIGVPIPGGSFELRPHPAAVEPGIGELVYRGDNVMMGYALSDDDLARGPDLDELCTGDLARRRPDGLHEIVGRASRFVKPFGVRVDLDHLERELQRSHPVVAVAGDDRNVVVAIAHGPTEPLRDAVVATTGLPRSGVHVVVCPEPPRTPSGKLDAPALVRLAATSSAAADDHRPMSVSVLFADVLGRDQVLGSDTFVGLGGDSLNYVECSIRLEELLGHVPHDWHLQPVDQLEQGPTERRSSIVRVDTTVLLRAFSICAVVSTHMRLQRFPGGAHLLLAVVGYNFARFQLAIPAARDRLRSGLRTATRVAVPVSAWIGVNMVLAGGYSLGTLALVNNYTGSAWRRDGRWEYWFFEVFVQLIVIVSLLLAVPAVRRVERRIPFGFALAFAIPCLAFRFRWIELGGSYNHLFRTHTVAWFFALGWMIAAATRRRHRILVAALAFAAVPGFFGRGQREAFIVGGLLLMLWVPTIPMPRLLRRPIGELASASMWIFLVHWQVWPIVDAPLKREVAYVLTIACGVLVARGVRRWSPLLRSLPSRLVVRVRGHRPEPTTAALGRTEIIRSPERVTVEV